MEPGQWNVPSTYNVVLAPISAIKASVLNIATPSLLSKCRRYRYKFVLDRFPTLIHIYIYIYIYIFIAIDEEIQFCLGTESFMLAITQTILIL